LAAVCVPLAIYVYQSEVTAEDLEKVVAETDRLDPGWRRDELDAKRKPVPDAENGGLLVIRAGKLLPGRWTARPVFDQIQEAQERGELEPPQLLDAGLAGQLRQELNNVQAALREARRLKDFPRGRYSVRWSEDFVSTLLPHLEPLRNVANLLSYDAMLRAQDGDLDGAWASTRAVLNCGRSVGDEPVLISVLVRLAVRKQAYQRMERVLGLGQVSDRGLADMQKLAENELQQPLLLTGMRGERAGLHQVMASIEAGKLSQAQLISIGVQVGFVERVMSFFDGNTIQRDHAFALRFMTDAVEIVKQPLDNQAKLLKELEAGLHDAPPLARQLVPACLKVTEAFHASQAQYRCALTALALERYRLARGEWPKALADLVPAHLGKVPTDPYDGKPLRFRRLADGVLVYSVGPDGVDNGGAIDRMGAMKNGSDMGFQLWDIAKRRRPPGRP
jgi:hypothetical protein